ncbi:MAG: hypothetical protein WD696_04200 [Bryobacteraceae bacterium]
MKQILLTLCLAAAVCAQPAMDSPTGTRITPPTITAVAPLGVSRGATVEMTIEGLNLANASAIYFSEPGVKARILRIKELPDLADIRLGSNGTPSTIDLGPLPPRNQITLEVDVDPVASIGNIGLRVQTPLGTSPEARFAIEPYYGEAPDREPNNTPESAFETYLPAILVGAVAQPGDEDFFKISVKAGEEILFDNGAEFLGSALSPVVSILDGKQNVLREYGADGGRETLGLRTASSRPATITSASPTINRAAGAIISIASRRGSFRWWYRPFPWACRRVRRRKCGSRATT